MDFKLFRLFLELYILYISVYFCTFMYISVYFCTFFCTFLYVSVILSEKQTQFTVMHRKVQKFTDIHRNPQKSTEKNSNVQECYRKIHFLLPPEYPIVLPRQHNCSPCIQKEFLTRIQIEFFSYSS